MKSASFLALALILVTLASCDPGLVYNESYAVPNHEWHRDAPFVFTSDSIIDTQQGYNAYIDLRVSMDYQYRNIYFFVTIEMPDKQVLRDTVQGELMDLEGNWKGDVSGFSTIKEKEFLHPYRKNFRFPKPGVYKFTVQQGMTDDVLRNIVDVGFKLRKAEKTE